MEGGHNGGCVKGDALTAGGGVEGGAAVSKGVEGAGGPSFHFPSKEFTMSTATSPDSITTTRYLYCTIVTDAYNLTCGGRCSRSGGLVRCAMVREELSERGRKVFSWRAY